MPKKDIHQVSPSAIIQESALAPPPHPLPAPPEPFLSLTTPVLTCHSQCLHCYLHYLYLHLAYSRWGILPICLSTQSLSCPTGLVPGRRYHCLLGKSQARSLYPPLASYVTLDRFLNLCGCQFLPCRHLESQLTEGLNEIAKARLRTQCLGRFSVSVSAPMPCVGSSLAPRAWNPPWNCFCRPWTPPLCWPAPGALGLPA